MLCVLIMLVHFNFDCSAFLFTITIATTLICNIHLLYSLCIHDTSKYYIVPTYTHYYYMITQSLSITSNS